MREKVVSIGFVSILLILLILNIIKKDEIISTSERRKIAVFPSITIEKLLSGKTAEEINQYTVDQFIGRDFFRKVKLFWSSNIFKQKDNNGLFIKNEAIYKIEYPLSEKNVEKSFEKIKNICEKYLKESKNIYYSIIPDKNYYLDLNYPKIDVKSIEKIARNILQKLNYIDITNKMGLEDYYRTDLHWKQENLIKIVNQLQREMNLSETSYTNYKLEELGNYYGAYYGQLGKEIFPDKIKILTNDIIENAVTYNYETGESNKVYDKERLEKSLDKYDVYLSGATPLITIENKTTNNQEELILFRDSFGSSIAPLLLNNYKKITLIDLRYISSEILNQYVNFENKDILFLYNIVILNQNILK